MKIGSETRRQEDNRHRHLHRQADTYSEKDMIRGETTKRKSKERERERENVKEKKILKPNRDIQSLERINNKKFYPSYSYFFYHHTKIPFIYKPFRTINYKIFNSTLRIHSY